MALASERLLALLVREIAAFEADVAGAEDDNPKGETVGRDGGAEFAAAAGAADAAQAGTRRRVAGAPAAAKGGPAKRGGATAAPGAGAGARRMGPKERIEHIGQMAKVLEKLLELRRLETLAAAGGPQDDAEAARLGAELLSRLRSLDARRRHGELLFGPEVLAGGAGAAGTEGDLAADQAGAVDATGGGR
ncbi:hypothetical protein [Aurantimonas sp. HBX-1]|uniref:hypothetical protein n=1 Tax=Aurantimonas sp. HBX-1 TaxID=2906072 RepID=UPI001F1AFAB0|nr:hypothetical protein [Aurantimonas sp. HBX-1]UIJ70645.1 hypothetical protein LXB15_12890 [Aurantimonas sp. HBX-1]